MQPSRFARRLHLLRHLRGLRETILLVILRHEEAVFANRFPVEAHFACLGIGVVYSLAMSTVHEIETAVSKLSRQELLAFRDWFSTFDAAAWDKQFEQDVAAGRLDGLADEAIHDAREGRCRDL